MEPLKRIQLNDDGTVQPTLQGGVQQNVFQNIVDTSQNNIDALPDRGVQGFVKSTAQVPQDFLNVIAHPVKTAQENYEYYKNNPKMLLPLNQAFEYQNQQNQELLNGTYNPSKELGSLTGGLLTGLTLGGLGGKSLPSRPSSPLPIQSGLGGDAMTIRAYNKPLSFQAELLSKGSGVPLSEVRSQLASRIKRNSSLPQGKMGRYNQITGNINIAPYSETIKYGRTPLDAATHEGWHYTMSRLEALDNAGLTTPEISKMLYDLKQSQSNKLAPLAENEALSRSMESSRNPNIQYNNATLDNIMVNPLDIQSGYKVINPLYKQYLGE